MMAGKKQRPTPTPTLRAHWRNRNLGSGHRPFRGIRRSLFHHQPSSNSNDRTIPRLCLCDAHVLLLLVKSAGNGKYDAASPSPGFLASLVRKMEWFAQSGRPKATSMSGYCKKESSLTEKLRYKCASPTCLDTTVSGLQCRQSRTQ
jgi:hypothetical protein